MLGEEGEGKSGKQILARTYTGNCAQPNIVLSRSDPHYTPSEIPHHIHQLPWGSGYRIGCGYILVAAKSFPLICEREGTRLVHGFHLMYTRPDVGCEPSTIEAWVAVDAIRLPKI